MFSAIYNAAKFQEQSEPLEGSTQSSQYSQYSQSSAIAQMTSTKPNKVRWERAGDEILDIKKEEIELCQNDHELHSWVVKTLFEPFELQNSHPTSSVAISTGEHSQPEPLPGYIYSQLLALVMRTFRSRYKDPHAALAVFDHVRNASVASYVTCCGTAAYNEFIETEWDSFRNLAGVYDALEEMKLNKVRIDTRTRSLVEGLRHRMGNRSTWQEDGFGESPLATMKLLEKIERSCWTAPTSQRPEGEEVGITKFSAKWKIGSEHAWKAQNLRTTGQPDRLELV